MPQGEFDFREDVPCIFFAKGFCWSGDRCKFSHGAQEIKSLQDIRCKYHDSGYCKEGDQCPFYHASASRPSSGSKRREHSPNTSRPEKRQGRRYQIGREKSYEARHSPSDNESSKSNSKRWAREHSRGKQRSSAYSQTNPQKIFQDQGFHRVDEPDRQHAAIIAVEQINQRILGSQNLNLENKASESFAHSPEDNTSYTDKFTPLIQDKLASFQQRDTTRKQSEDVSPSVQTVFESKQYKTDVRAPKTSPDPTVENGVRLYSIAGIPVYRFNNTPEEQNSSRKIDQAVRSDREPPSTAWQDIPETSKPSEKERWGYYYTGRHKVSYRKEGPRLERESSDEAKRRKRERSPSPWRSSQRKPISSFCLKLKQCCSGLAQDDDNKKAKPVTPLQANGSNQEKDIDLENLQDPEIRFCLDYDESMKAKQQAESIEPHQKIWYYSDPEGLTQGPCSIYQFQGWLAHMAADYTLVREYKQFQEVCIWTEEMQRSIPLMVVMGMHPTLCSFRSFP